MRDRAGSFAMGCYALRQVSTTFKALLVEERDGGVARRIATRTLDDLPPGDVLIRVRYSSLNYKDALSATGNRGVTRRYPHTPGIDAAGEVVASTAPTLPAGLPVIVTGFDLGMNLAGGWGEYIRVPAGWVVPLPTGLTLREAMAFGTAGLTAALSVRALQEGGVKPGDGPVLVTGATGGVGSLAVGILARAGYAVTAATGKAAQREALLGLGAEEIVDRAAVAAAGDRPLLGGHWAGVVDTVGGALLDGALRATRRGGVVTACGMVASARLETSIFPFILRGIRLQGIETAETPMGVRREMWMRLGGGWKPAQGAWGAWVRETGLEGLEDGIARILAGGMTGRLVVKHA